MPKLCPCTSGRPYADCCAPLHRSEREAESPGALMRSRFAAFALADADYVWRTLHPDHGDRALPREEVVQAIRATSRALKYMRLRILDTSDAQVLFLASVFEKGRDRSFVELSTFAHEGTAWRYVAGEVVDAREVGDPTSLTIESFERLVGAG